MTLNSTARTRLPAEWGATGPSREESIQLTEEPAGPGIYIGLSTGDGRSDDLGTSIRLDTPFTSSEEDEEIRVINLPAFRLTGVAGDSFGAMQEWEGIVTRVDADVFSAELFDLTAGHSEPNEIAELPIADIQSEDLQRLRVGAAFRWLVGYAKSSNGVKTRGFRIHFREPLLYSEDTKIPDLIFDDARPAPKS